MHPNSSHESSLQLRPPLPSFKFPQGGDPSADTESIATATAEEVLNEDSSGYSYPELARGNTTLVTSDQNRWADEGPGGRPRTSSYTSQASGNPGYFNQNPWGFNPTIGSAPHHPSSAGSGTHRSHRVEHRPHRLEHYDPWGYSVSPPEGNQPAGRPPSFFHGAKTSAPSSNAPSAYSEMMANSDETWNQRLKDLHNTADIKQLEFEETMEPKPNNGMKVTRKYTASFSRRRPEKRRGRSNSTSSQNPDPAPLGHQPMRPDAASSIPVASPTQGTSVDGIGKQGESDFVKDGKGARSVDKVDNATLPQSAASLSDSSAAAEEYSIPKGPEAERSDNSMQSVDDSRASTGESHDAVAQSRGGERGHAAGRGRGSGGLPPGQGRGRGNNSDRGGKKAEKPKSERGRGRGRGMGREVGFQGEVRVPKGHRGVTFGEGYLKKMHGVEGTQGENTK